MRLVIILVVLGALGAATRAGALAGLGPRRSGGQGGRPGENAYRFPSPRQERERWSRSLE